MSEPIKQTLFRFVNMRSPELITDEAKQTYFIEHHDGISGYFFTALGVISPGADKREALLSTVDSSGFTAYTSVDNVKSVNTPLFNLGKYLMLNRTSLTTTDVATKIAELAPVALTSGDKTAIWDNLFYQTLTSESSYIREALIELLIANHFFTKYALVSTEDDIYMKLASSVVVLPNELFALDVSLSSESTLNIDSSNNINKAALSKQMIVAESSLKAQLISDAKKELENYEEVYNKDYKTAFTTAKATFDSDLITAVSGATTASVVDQFTGFTLNTFTAITYPVLSFTPDAQIDSTALESVLSTPSYYVLDSNNLLEEDSFGAVQNKLNSLGTQEAQKAFSASKFVNEISTYNGTILHSSDNYSLGEAYSYFLKPIKRADNNYGLLLILVLGSEGAQVNDVSVTVGAPLDVTSTKFTTSESGRIVTIDLTPTNGFAISDATSSIQVLGSIEVMGGISLSWDTTLVMSKGVYGIMNADIPTGQNVDIYTSGTGYGIRRLGIADYRKVEQSLCGYVPGEVSHIENILAREYKERSTRRLRRSENTTTTSTETERENLTDTSSTARYEMQSEISEILRRDTSFGVNANVNANFGTALAGVSVNLGANYAVNNSKEVSKNQAVNFAKDVTEKASEKIVSKVKEERIIKIIEEFEEQNKHGFDNRLGADHVSGVYRWVDKVYKNQIQNYGKRLMYEFMIPEPARLHFTSGKAQFSGGAGKMLQEPKDPRTTSFGVLGKLENSSKINEFNYQSWAAVYNSEVEPPPASKLVVGKSYSKSQQQGDGGWEKSKAITDNVVIPDGYGLDKVFISSKCTNLDTGAYLSIGVADQTKVYSFLAMDNQLFASDTESTEIDKYSESIPVSVFFEKVHGGTVNISLELKRKKEIYEKWQLETFNTIVTGFEEKLQKYKDELAEAEVQRGNILAANPAYYREIENTLLRKNCIAYMVGHSNMGKRHISGDTISDLQVNNTQEMDTYAATAKFFEQAFEWELISYHLYPFYWAGKNNWSELYNYDNEDSIFRDFMRAGLARVVVTVRPGFEEAVMYYMATGQIWNGGQVPVIADDLYLSIIDEIKDPEYTITETWTTRLPSTLTLVQQGTVALDATGLPNWCNTGTPPDDDIIAGTSSLINYVDGYTQPPV